ncbi:MAG: hypothetical protein FJ161_00980 [Gammaproteobacteria bacterium]|nr:hypothetical protein [Gammaproteobacteria bacterium]
MLPNRSRFFDRFYFERNFTAQTYPYNAQRANLFHRRTNILNGLYDFFWPPIDAHHISRGDRAFLILQIVLLSLPVIVFFTVPGGQPIALAIAGIFAGWYVTAALTPSIYNAVYATFKIGSAQAYREASWARFLCADFTAKTTILALFVHASVLSILLISMALGIGTLAFVSYLAAILMQNIMHAIAPTLMGLGATILWSVIKQGALAYANESQLRTIRAGALFREIDEHRAMLRNQRPIWQKIRRSNLATAVFGEEQQLTSHHYALSEPCDSISHTAYYTAAHLASYVAAPRPSWIIGRLWFHTLVGCIQIVTYPLALTGFISSIGCSINTDQKYHNNVDQILGDSDKKNRDFLIQSQKYVAARTNQEFHVIDMTTLSDKNTMRYLIPQCTHGTQTLSEAEMQQQYRYLLERYNAGCRVNSFLQSGPPLYNQSLSLAIYLEEMYAIGFPLIPITPAIAQALEKEYQIMTDRTPISTPNLKKSGYLEVELQSRPSSQSPCTNLSRPDVQKNRATNSVTRQET